MSRLKSYSWLLSSCLFIAMAGVVSPATQSHAAAIDAQAEPLRLVAATNVQAVERYAGSPITVAGLGMYAEANGAAFQVILSRLHYGGAVNADQIYEVGSTKRKHRLPAGLVKDPNILDHFFDISVVNQAGKTIAKLSADFCPNSSQAARAEPSAPGSSPFPTECGTNPFVLGTVLGLQAGWSVPLFGDASSLPSFDGPDGTYHFNVSISDAYRRAFGISAADGRSTISLVVSTISESQAVGAHAASRRLPSALSGTASSGTVTSTAKPDLRALPAWQINLTGQPGPGSQTTSFLNFSAAVWNAGPSPMVVEGFRRRGTDLMDAYQYFLDAHGRQVGYKPAGQFMYDSRPGHQHWHFEQFAQYQLLDANKQLAVRSEKTGFCLAPTDPIDLTVPGANWQPYATGLASACGDQSALAIKEALDVGWGDTYVQSLPGQSFDVSNLKAGTYYVAVIANPDGLLQETNTANDRSLRKIVLGGVAGGTRTVTVAPYDGLNVP